MRVLSPVVTMAGLRGLGPCGISSRSTGPGIAVGIRVSIAFGVGGESEYLEGAAGLASPGTGLEYGGGGSKGSGPQMKTWKGSIMIWPFSSSA